MIKKVSQQDGKLRQVRAQAREFPNRTSYVVHRTSYISGVSPLTAPGHPVRIRSAPSAQSARTSKSYIVHRISYMGCPRLPPSYMANAFPNAFALAVVPLSVTRCFCSRNSHVFTGAFFFLPAPSSNVTPAYLPLDLPDLLS